VAYFIWTFDNEKKQNFSILDMSSMKRFCYFERLVSQKTPPGNELELSSKNNVYMGDSFFGSCKKSSLFIEVNRDTSKQFFNAFLMNMNYEYSFISGKKLADLVII
jgi:hypothetical protein